MTCYETYEATDFACRKKGGKEKAVPYSWQLPVALPLSKPCSPQGFFCAVRWQVAASPAGLLYSSYCPYLPPLQYKAAEGGERLQDKSQSWSEPDERKE